MIYPSIEELSRGGIDNRYMLCIATAKCAREITEEQIAAFQQIQRDIKDEKFNTRANIPSEKPVRTAINRLDNSDFTIYVAEKVEY